MPKQSAGILMYRVDSGFLEVLIVHPGGPLWRSKDAGAWSIPKGEFLPGRDPLENAIREFEEELGSPVPGGEFLREIPFDGPTVPEAEPQSITNHLSDRLSTNRQARLPAYG